MASQISAHNDSNSMSGESKHSGLPRRLVSLCIAAYVVSATGCGACGWGHQRCRTAPVQPVCYHPVINETQPVVSPPVASPIQQSDRQLMGDYGLTPDAAVPNELPIDQPVEIAPVPEQWNQRLQQKIEQPPSEASPDSLELEADSKNNPSEI